MPKGIIRHIATRWQAMRSRIARRAAFNRALAHNKRHTYACYDLRVVGGTWMCPTCGTVHECVSHNVFTGRQFPACCEFAEGHRLYRCHATGL